METELSRHEYIILNVLAKKNYTNFYMSATLQEIIDVIPISRPTLYRKMMKMVNCGYIQKGCKSVNADTFYLTEKGKKLIKDVNGGEESDD